MWNAAGKAVKIRQSYAYAINALSRELRVRAVTNKAAVKAFQLTGHELCHFSSTVPAFHYMYSLDFKNIKSIPIWTKAEIEATPAAKILVNT